MQIHQITRNYSRKKRKRIGRGGKRGTYSGRGIKGQKARAGGRIRPQMRDVIKKIPKKRGYRFQSFKEKPYVVNIGMLGKLFNKGETVTPQILVAKGLVRQKKGAHLRVKILGNGELYKKITISGCLVSDSAREKVEKAGGSVKLA